MEQQTLQPGFWDDADTAKRVQKELGKLQDLIEGWEGRWALLEEADLLLEMAAEEEDYDTEHEVAASLPDMETTLEVAELECMFSGEHDTSNAIISIHAGAGGTEAQDWVGILLRMYLRWAEAKGFKADILDILAGDEAGTKSVTFIIKGRFAYGYMRSELGIHRLVRISPFDASGRRHTSFASVMVMPELDDTIDVDIDEKDLRVDTYRASGSGGQHVNKTDSAIRITHIPSGVVVQCQNERSQHRNRDMAMKMLASRLYELEKEKQAEQQAGLHGDKKDISWGSQIRSYVLQPYRLIKDHRTEVEMGNVDAVLDGNLDMFIKAYLLWAK
ncbi:bacterial peptide chain release factor 2 (bRF-2) [Desulfocapsa sulfexigens DSM 10523]|uniref:Peptide chain release factor 2 n=1 Tax=Desulfocapsa sulfexigens (strain DSM 10523 / SB164P1) TaxID=1167006 RepID=M1PAE0_DESSD|nr:bacterial peptide chain release factor 2 (bRF-2) [Desulfocapsa sulfexigens DSM 10523]